VVLFVPRPQSFAEWCASYLKRGTMPPTPKLDNFGISAKTVRDAIIAIPNEHFGDGRACEDGYTIFSRTRNGELEEFSRRCAERFDISSQDALEQFTAMWQRCSFPRLDTYGISTGNVRERLRKENQNWHTMDTEGRQQAFLSAVLDEAEVMLD